jgi:hypothetical protein
MAEPSGFAALGPVAYRAYAESTGGKTYDGHDMPGWEQLPENIRQAWAASARAVAVVVANLARETTRGRLVGGKP